MGGIRRSAVRGRGGVKAGAGRGMLAGIRAVGFGLSGWGGTWGGGTTRPLPWGGGMCRWKRVVTSPVPDAASTAR